MYTCTISLLEINGTNGTGLTLVPIQAGQVEWRQDGRIESWSILSKQFVSLKTDYKAVLYFWRLIIRKKLMHVNFFDSMLQSMLDFYCIGVYFILILTCMTLNRY